jgi:hypothetical protein
LAGFIVHFFPPSKRCPLWHKGIEGGFDFEGGNSEKGTSIMSIQNDDIKLKLAWQTAFELRTCPDNKTLHASDQDENLNRHLAICHVCRDKREMQQDERDAWKTLKENFATLTMKPGIGTDKQAGQVWTIKREFGGWRDDGRYIKPPSVMLLEKVDGTSGWRVAQLYSDTRLMGSSDVTLDERYGFVETWNCYSQKEDRFDKCLGGVKHEELKQVLAASVASHEPAPEGSILSFFRSMEIEVGAFMAVPAVAEMVEEWERATEEVFELIPGLKLAVSGAKDFVLYITEGTMDLLRGTFKPALVTRGGGSKPAAAKLSDEQKKLVQEHCAVVPIDMKLAGDTLTITLKWLRKKPVELPVVKVILDGIAVSEAVFASVAADKIVMQHPLFSNVVASQIASLKLSFVDDAVSLQISMEKIR